MRRISTATRVIGKFGAGKDGFTNGDAVSGIPATDLEDVWFDHVQEEISNVVEAAGLTLDPSNRAQLLEAIGKLSTGRVLNVRVITSTTVYVPTNGTKAVYVRLQGGGGGGGGSSNTAAGQLSAGSGGQSGAYAESFLTSGFSGLTVTIGNGGSGGTVGGAGSAGGTSSFGALMSCPGGTGGASSGALTPPSFVSTGPNSAVATGGNLFNGSTGQGLWASLLSTNAGLSGAGAGSLFGNGPTGNNLSGGGGTASNKGCGGGGALTGPSASGFPGGAGAPGVAIIWEFA